MKPSCRLRGRARRATAALGVFALLFQAMILAWHHHQLPFSSQTVTPSVLAAPGPAAPLATDRDCEICFSLGHHGAVPAALFMAAPPQVMRPQRVWVAAIAVLPAPYLLFQPRAPPRA